MLLKAALVVRVAQFVFKWFALVSSGFRSRSVVFDLFFDFFFDDVGNVFQIVPSCVTLFLLFKLHGLFRLFIFRLSCLRLFRVVQIVAGWFDKL